MVLFTAHKKVHAFDKSFKAAKLYEAELDKHFGQFFDITAASREQERLGIDRFFEHRRSGMRYSVEYKTDHATPETGNVFIETMSVDTAGKRGWAYTSTAQVLAYYVPEDGYVMRADMTAIKRAMPGWSGRSYREATAWNRGGNGESYRTLGRLVPVEEFRRVCSGIGDVTRLPGGEEWEPWGIRQCIHDLPRDICKVCNGTVKRMIGEAS